MSKSRQCHASYYRGDSPRCHGVQRLWQRSHANPRSHANTHSDTDTDTDTDSDAGSHGNAGANARRLFPAMEEVQPPPQEVIDALKETLGGATLADLASLAGQGDPSKPSVSCAISLTVSTSRTWYWRTLIVTPECWQESGDSALANKGHLPVLRFSKGLS